MQFDRY